MNSAPCNPFTRPEILSFSPDFQKEIDTSKTNDLKGDATAEGVTFELHASEKITNQAGTKTYYEKGALVSSKKTDANGKIAWSELPLGKYYIQE